MKNKEHERNYANCQESKQVIDLLFAAVLALESIYVP